MLRVSVVMPSFNQGRFVERAIRSVLSQNYPRLEFLVFDGGSTDATPGILQRYAPAVRWVSEPDRGQSHAINKGLALADGDVIAWLNADDLYAPGALAAVGAQDVHLRHVTAGGLSFTGLSGSPRYSRRPGAYEWTAEQAEALVARLPAADVLLTHTPPLGVDDEPDDPVHRGFAALGPWVERHRPAWLLHGHTQPHPARRVARLGTTRVVHVRGAVVLDLSA
jgi:glycosyltransferase involved in cell wall biosynthesis